MILADSSVWIDHFRQANPLIPELLEQELIVMHPYVVGEICLGSLADRHEVLEWLDGLPAAITANDAEVRVLIEKERLFGVGIGYVDAHLLASALIMAEGRLWTHDKRLRQVAERLARAATLNH